MVATVDEILQVVRSNPFIDGIGYFIEVTTVDPVPSKATGELSDMLRDAFCEHAQVNHEGDNVLGLDFHEHIFTRGEEAQHDLRAVERVLKTIEMDFGIDHLCIEFQFDLQRARNAKREMDELLKP